MCGVRFRPPIPTKGEEARMQPFCGVSDLTEAGQLREEANWPDSCRMDIGIYIDWSGFSESRTRLTKDQCREAFARGWDSWNRAGRLRLFEAERRENARAIREWKRLRGSVLGWSYLADDTCSRKLQALDSDRVMSQYVMYRLSEHEDGHLVGLPHDDRRTDEDGKPSVMYPLLQTTGDGLNKRDVRRLRALGYAAPDPDDPRPPDDPWVRLAQARAILDEMALDEANAAEKREKLADILAGAKPSGGGWDFG